ncbi:MAG: polysaccharide biosynthesis C-terminal domain-containing protein, partial [Candidatus Omnitrophica bacterium]|nr:polysaccharide biosynthesis C-terminal domain-containing protein [Candidatus Omnitrophota bacterium]
AFYAMGDTKTPVKTAALALGVNLLLNLMLMYPLKIGGLALSTSLAASVNLTVLYIVLSKKIGDIGTRDLIRAFLKISAASLVMVSAAVILRHLWLKDGIKGLDAAIHLGAIIAVSMVVYVIAAVIFKIEGIKEIKGSILRRLGR